MRLPEGETVNPSDSQLQPLSTLNSPQSDPPPSPVIGAPSRDEGEASNSGGVPAPTPPQLSGRAKLPLSPDQNVLVPQVECPTPEAVSAVRDQVKQSHTDAITKLEAIAKAERAAGGEQWDDLINGCSQILDEAGEFKSKMLGAQMNLTVFRPKPQPKK